MLVTESVPTSLRAGTRVRWTHRDPKTHGITTRFGRVIPNPGTTPEGTVRVAQEDSRTIHTLELATVTVLGPA